MDPRIRIHTKMSWIRNTGFTSPILEQSWWRLEKGKPRLTQFFWMRDSSPFRVRHPSFSITSPARGKEFIIKSN
jgi:hypothetical protein